MKGKNAMLSFVDMLINEQGFIDTMLETKDRAALKMYLNFKSIAQRPFVTHYARMFGLCRLLGAANIYDIGCGNQYQAYMLTYPDIHYLGIDADDRIDFDEMNQAFSNGFGAAKKFLHAVYPCPLDLSPNNIAIACGYAYSREDNGLIQGYCDAISRDFERIITNFGIWGDSDEEKLRFWENALPDHTVQKLGDQGMIFATKIPRDLEIMHETAYHYQDDRFLIGAPELQALHAKYHSH